MPWLRKELQTEPTTIWKWPMTKREKKKSLLEVSFWLRLRQERREKWVSTGGPTGRRLRIASLESSLLTRSLPTFIYRIYIQVQLSFDFIDYTLDFTFCSDFHFLPHVLQSGVHLWLHRGRDARKEPLYFPGERVNKISLINIMMNILSWSWRWLELWEKFATGLFQAKKALDARHLHGLQVNTSLYFP